LTKDKKYLDPRTRKVLNKNARWNNCIADIDQPADYESGRGTIINFNKLPILSRLRDRLNLYLGDKANRLIAETNYYYDPKKCGIGFHGDAERFLVVGVRLGETMPLKFQWFYDSRPVGDSMTVELEHGTVYAMAEKTTGNDWKKRKIYTLRHSAGCDKYTNLDRFDD